MGYLSINKILKAIILFLFTLKSFAMPVSERPSSDFPDEKIPEYLAVQIDPKFYSSMMPYITSMAFHAVLRSDPRSLSSCLCNPSFSALPGELIKEMDQESMIQKVMDNRNLLPFLSHFILCHLPAALPEGSDLRALFAFNMMRNYQHLHKNSTNMRGLRYPVAVMDTSYSRLFDIEIELPSKLHISFKNAAGLKSTDLEPTELLELHTIAAIHSLKKITIDIKNISTSTHSSTIRLHPSNVIINVPLHLDSTSHVWLGDYLERDTQYQKDVLTACTHHPESSVTSIYSPFSPEFINLICIALDNFYTGQYGSSQTTPMTPVEVSRESTLCAMVLNKSAHFLIDHLWRSFPVVCLQPDGMFISTEALEVINHQRLGAIEAFGASRAIITNGLSPDQIFEHAVFIAILEGMRQALLVWTDEMEVRRRLWAGKHPEYADQIIRACNRIQGYTCGGHVSAASKQLWNIAIEPDDNTQETTTEALELIGTQLSCQSVVLAREEEMHRFHEMTELRNGVEAKAIALEAQIKELGENVFIQMEALQALIEGCEQNRSGHLRRATDLVQVQETGARQLSRFSETSRSFLDKWSEMKGQLATLHRALQVQQERITAQGNAHRGALEKVTGLMIWRDEVHRQRMQSITLLVKELTRVYETVKTYPVQRLDMLELRQEQHEEQISTAWEVLEKNYQPLYVESCSCKPEAPHTCGLTSHSGQVPENQSIDFRIQILLKTMHRMQREISSIRREATHVIVDMMPLLEEFNRRIADLTEAPLSLEHDDSSNPGGNATPQTRKRAAYTRSLDTLRSSRHRSSTQGREQQLSRRQQMNLLANQVLADLEERPRPNPGDPLRQLADDQIEQFLILGGHPVPPPAVAQALAEPDLQPRPFIGNGSIPHLDPAQTKQLKDCIFGLHALTVTVEKLSTLTVRLEQETSQLKEQDIARELTIQDAVCSRLKPQIERTTSCLQAQLDEFQLNQEEWQAKHNARAQEEFSTLSRQLQQFEFELERLEASLGDLPSIRELQDELYQLKSEMGALNRKVNSADSSFTAFLERTETMRDEMKADLTAHGAVMMEQLEEEIAEAKANLRLIKAELDKNLSKQQTAMKEALEECQDLKTDYWTVFGKLLEFEQASAEKKAECSTMLVTTQELLTDTQQQAREVRKEVDSLHEYSTLQKQESTALVASTKALRTDVEAISTELTTQKGKLEDNKKAIGKLLPETQEQTKKLAEMSERHEECVKALNELHTSSEIQARATSERSRLLTERLAELEKNVQMTTDSKTRFEAQLQDLGASLDVCTSTLTSQQQKMKENEKVLTQLTPDLEARRKEVDMLTKDWEESKRKQAKCDKELSTLVTEVATLESQLHESSKLNAALQEKLRVQERALEERDLALVNSRLKEQETARKTARLVELLATAEPKVESLSDAALKGESIIMDATTRYNKMLERQAHSTVQQMTRLKEQTSRLDLLSSQFLQQIREREAQRLQSEMQKLQHELTASTGLKIHQMEEYVSLHTIPWLDQEMRSVIEQQRQRIEQRSDDFFKGIDQRTDDFFRGLETKLNKKAQAELDRHNAALYRMFTDVERQVKKTKTRIEGEKAKVVGHPLAKPPLRSETKRRWDSEWHYQSDKKKDPLWL
ncbi:hypothetical protein ACWJJH_15800 [Endozoicomonadaceae bacterium StTr2]